MTWKERLSLQSDIKRREMALAWWNSTTKFIKEHYSQRYFNRSHETLTGREVQMIHEGDKLKSNL